MPATQIDRDAFAILRLLAEAPRNEYVDRNDVGRLSNLSPERVNDAVALLVDSGYAEWIQTFGTAPYDFNSVSITSRGRYEYQRLSPPSEEAGAEQWEPSELGRWESDGGPLVSSGEVIRPPAPLGSPYGFTDEDWENVAERKHEPERLYVVLGHQFESGCFDTAALRANVEAMLQKAVARYNASQLKPSITLDFRVLNAGYGEHLFNEIARDIIGSDVAVFETSDLNPNVMLEMGVALTWGVRVLPIKLEGRSKPPSDVSGQTWADYREHAAVFADPDHEPKLVRMIDRAMRKKVRAV